MVKYEKLAENLGLQDKFSLSAIKVAFTEVTVECNKNVIFDFLTDLKNNKFFAFDQLIDLCVVDYLSYAQSAWETHDATDKGFCRAANQHLPNQTSSKESDKGRFAVVYHLLSTKLNQRLRVKVFISEENLIVPSVHTIWKAANWFEREAYDLYGVLFSGHPDLRRILTDYGFIGHPFRKDFPVSGHVEMRYDAKLQKVIYEPVDIEPRILEPRVVRNDSRYIDE
jgi:NADH-quinone oxidoreductase subunit C